MPPVMWWRRGRRSRLSGKGTGRGGRYDGRAMSVDLPARSRSAADIRVELHGSVFEKTDVRQSCLRSVDGVQGC